MTGRKLRTWTLAGAGVAVCACGVWGQAKKGPSEPRITSAYPMGLQRGSDVEVTIRGAALGGARAIEFADTGLTGKVVGVSQDPANKEVDLVRVKVSAAEGAGAADHKYRLITERGISNEGVLRVTADRTILESAALGEFPVVVNGVLKERGETDAYWIEAKAGETLTFEAKAGGTLDPGLSLWVSSGSWFDTERLERVAVNDDPLYFPGLSTDARLVHRFEKAGRYCLKVAGFNGQTGPDAVYQLRIVRGETEKPSLHPKAKPKWTERMFTRRVGPEWATQVAARGSGKPGPAIETYRAVVEGSAEIPLIPGKGLVEGRLGKAAEAHVIKLKIDQPQDLAIEIETPEATMPRFNPVVRVMQPDGHEVVTNVYTKRNNNGLYMMKMIQAKTTVTLRSAGEYLVQIRDITTDCWAPDFAYRVLIRPAMAHVGQVEIVEDRMNLEPGQSKPLTVHLDREEGFKGFVAISVEGLPEGVVAVTGMENPIEKPPLPNGGRLERYVGIPQTSTVMVMASEGAKEMQVPAMARVIVRPVVDGKAGAPVLTKMVPVMVVGRRAS